ncbi:hypothetical protein [Paraburkholderia sp. CI3]|uniref:hypothetical protein n=1 Tax=Paraburkholderia sp. CI3 TaxID=2991060 RepID=UPI003D22FBF7
MSYELRRLRLHGLIERVPKTHRYHLTDLGLQTALFHTRVYSRILRPGLALVSPQAPAASPASLQRSFCATEQALKTWCDQVKNRPVEKLDSIATQSIQSRNLASRATDDVCRKASTVIKRFRHFHHDLLRDQFSNVTTPSGVLLQQQLPTPGWQRLQQGSQQHGAQPQSWQQSY